MDTVEVHEMINGMCYRWSERVKLIRGECQDPRDMLLEEERGIR